jgi:hypothetical protein
MPFQIYPHATQPVTAEQHLQKPPQPADRGLAGQLQPQNDWIGGSDRGPAILVGRAIPLI